VIWLLLGGVAMAILSAIFGVSFTGIEGSQQEMMQQAMQNSESANDMQMIINAFFNLPIANLAIAFVCFFLGGYLLNAVRGLIDPSIAGL
jgi:ABC-2 type transport system permease protein